MIDQGSVAPSKEEMIVGAATYLMVFVGMWFWGPLLVYIVARRSRPWVAWHALQALILHVSFALWIIGAFTLKVLFLVAVGIFVTKVRGGWGDAAEVFGVVVYVIATVLPFALTARGTWLAARGRIFQVPLFGRIAHRYTDMPAEPT